ncbi:MAG: hypothetical protein PHT69_11030 [Bacteroidales bacterium]|nr:hypothetical protein [Bacteroidales bacterium]
MDFNKFRPTVGSTVFTELQDSGAVFTVLRFDKYTNVSDTHNCFDKKLHPVMIPAACWVL